MRLQRLRLIMKLLIQGLILTIILIVIQFELDGAKNSAMMYMPPLGFVFLLVATYLIQPVIIGVINIFIINVFFGTKGWQVGFWLNGIFLLLVFSTVNLVMQTALGLPFMYAAVVDVVALTLPFGCVARFSNGGWKKPIN
jgi:hypothetical protein